MAAPSALVVSTDLDEYSRFEANKSIITVTVQPTGSNMAGEPVDLKIYKARHNRDVLVAAKRVTLSGGSADAFTFDINTIVDPATLYPKMRRGLYFIKATAVNNTVATDTTADFRVSLITVDGLKAEYLYGIDFRAQDKLDVHTQPQLITGVTVTGVSKGHPEGWFPLQYTYTVDNTMPTPVATRGLSWCGGPLVTISTVPATYTLRKGDTDAYIDVLVGAVGSLPTQTMTEMLRIEKALFSTTKIRDTIDKAISWVEDTQLSVYLEPTRISTVLDSTVVSFGSNTDIPTFTEYDVDEIVDAITHYQASAGHWMNIKFPYYPIIKIEELFGQMADTRIVDVDLQWIEFHERSGFVELVPFHQTSAFNFIGLMWVESLRAPVPMPNFWNFTAIVGFRKLPHIVLELIAKKAAIDVLTVAGQAYRGGIASSSISRDGISESVSYAGMSQYGPFSPAINAYKEWINQNLKDIEGDLRGPNLWVT